MSIITTAVTAVITPHDVTAVRLNNTEYQNNNSFPTLVVNSAHRVAGNCAQTCNVKASSPCDVVVARNTVAANLWGVATFEVPAGYYYLINMGTFDNNLWTEWY